MDEQNNHVLEIIPDAGQVVQNTISAAASEAVSLSGDLNSRVHWMTTLGPQNTYITFHTLPFSLDQIGGTTEVTAVGESNEVSVISSIVSGQEQQIVSDGGSSKQFVLSDSGSNKQYVLSDSGNNKQFVISDNKQFVISDIVDNKQFVVSDSGSNKQFVLSDNGSSKQFVVSDGADSKQFVLSDSVNSRQFVLSDGGDVKGFVLSDGGDGKQFVLSDCDSSKQNVAFPKPVQTQLLQTTNENKVDIFPVQSRLVLQAGAKDEPTVYSEQSACQAQIILHTSVPGEAHTSFQEQNQSQIILQASIAGEQNTAYSEPNISFQSPSQFVIQNTSKDSTSYSEPDLSGFILPNSSQDSSFVEQNSSQFMPNASNESDNNASYAEPSQTEFMLENSVKDQSDASYSQSIQSSLASQFVETGAGGKVEAEGARSNAENESRTEQQRTDVDELSIFSNISVTISSTLLELIPNGESELLREVQADPHTQLQKTDLGYTLSAGLDRVVHIYNYLQDLLNTPGSSRLKFVGEEATKPEVRDQGTHCNILVPFVSSRGREIHQPSRYGGCLQLQELDDSVDGGDSRPAVSRRGRKGHPKKFNGSLLTRKAADPVPHTSPTGTNAVEDVQKQYNYDSSVEFTPKYTCSRKPEKGGKQYEELSPFKFFCTMCSFRTKRESHFIKHRKLHENNRTKLQHCSKCNFVCVRLSVLRRHEIVHSTHVYQCSACPYKADNLKLLRRHGLLRHEANHEKRNQLKFCPSCDYKTVHYTLYNRHLQTHASTRTLPTNGTATEFVCNDCSYTTIRKEHYIRHRKNVHGNARPFLCDTCGMAFKRPDTLAQHKIVHVDRKDRMFAFSCSQCNKRFRSQAHLKEHETMHSKDRPFLCDHCGASFKTPQVQKKHIQSIHLNPRSFSCSHCSKRFNTKYALQRHLRTHELQQQQQQQQQQQEQMDLQTTTDIPAVDIEQSDIPSLSADQLTEIDPDTLQTIQTQQALDAVGVAMEETFDQSDETLHQAYIQPNETTTALLYLTGNLQNIEYNPS